MGYVFRVRAASFFAGAATASFLGLYILHNDYKTAHQALFQQIKGMHESLDQRILAVEKSKRNENLQPAESTE